MHKPFYTDYVRHSLRFYSRNLTQPHFKKGVDRKNWLACNSVVSSYPEQSRDIIVYVYGSYDTLSDNVYEISKKQHIHQNVIWDLMKEVERRVAIERGLM